MFRSKKVHHQEFSCRIQTLWYNSLTTDLHVEDVLSNYTLTTAHLVGFNCNSITMHGTNNVT